MSRRPSFLRRIFAPAIAQGGRLARDERGVTVVEFGILALPFFTLIFAILETGFMFLATQVLDSAVEDASRVVRTGQAQNSGYTMTEFRDHMCDYTFGMFDCSQIKLKVQVLPTFTSASTTPPVQNCTLTACTWTITEGFVPGAKREVVQVFAYYRWPLVVTLPYFNLKNQPDNFRLLSATRVFRNEPF